MAVDKPVRAGVGSNGCYSLGSPPTVDPALVRRTGRAGINIAAVRGYVHGQGPRYLNKMVGGVVEVHVGGRRRSVPLGCFDLTGGARTAPLLAAPLVRGWPYSGEPIALVVHWAAMRSGAALCGMMDAAAAVATQVLELDDRRLEGPQGALPVSDILETLCRGVRGALDDASGVVQLFDGSATGACRFSLGRGESERFVLLHRGSRLSHARLSVSCVAGVPVDVLHGGRPLRDGAWLLFRVWQRSVESSSS